VVALRVVPLTLAQANDLVARWHRHHKRVIGHRFSVGVIDASGEFHGAAIVGRPVARAVDQDRTAEVTRLVTDGTYNACSMLYGAAARAAQAMGYDRIQTYTLDSEPGTSLRAAGWQDDGTVRGRSWTTPSRPRVDSHPTVDKRRWVKTFRP
jgi:hypothetical protein